MFTKIGEYLKPILGRRDHIPLDKDHPIDPDDNKGNIINKDNEKKANSQSIERNDDEMTLSLAAIEKILEAETLENIDLYGIVQYLVKSLKKKDVTHITLYKDEKLLGALENAAFEHGVKKYKE